MPEFYQAWFYHSTSNYNTLQS